MNMRRYALLSVMLPVLVLLAVALANRVTDPYQIFSAHRDAIHNDKPALHPNIRVHKAYQVKLQAPDALILGTSKAIQGIPIDHAYFADKRAYNLAVSSTRNAIKRALAAGAVTNYSEDAQGRLGPVPAIGTHRIVTELGARTDAEVRSRLIDGGHRSNTLKIEELFTSAVYLPAPLRQFQFATADEDSLYWYEQFIRTLHENNIRASLAISPSHARFSELIDPAGLWLQWETWKRRMLSINLELADEYGKTPYALFDFSIPGLITMEPFPEAGDTEYHMKYFVESIHFNQHTGALMLDKLMSRPRRNRRTSVNH